MNSGDVWVLRERRKDRPWVPCLFRSWALDGEVADCFTPKFGRASVDGGVESGGKREKRRWIVGTDQAEGTPRGWGGTEAEVEAHWARATQNACPVSSFCA